MGLGPIMEICAVRWKKEPRRSSPKGSGMTYMMIMKNGQSGLVAIGPVDIEYEAAMLRDDIE